MVEIDPELKAQHPRYSNRHIRVAGKITINLNRIKCCRNHCVNAAEAAWVGIECVDNWGYIVGDDGLLKIANEKEYQKIFEIDRCQ